MPAKRLPWFKMWPEAMRHEKIALLSDGLFRTWVKTLADGSEQAIRWRFANVQHAAGVTGRPVKHIRDLIAARLLDERSDGEVWVHDWRQWQDRYESDFTPKPTAEDSVKTPPTLRDRSDLSTRETEERLKRRDTERELEPEPHVPGELDVVVRGAGGAAVAANGATAPTTAAAKGQAEILRGLSDDARAVLDSHREAHGRRSLTKLTPESARVLEDAVADLGLDRIRESIRYMAGKIPPVPDLSKAISAARTKRTNDESGGPLTGHRNGSSKPPPRRPGPPIPSETSAYLQTRNGTLRPR